MGTLPACLLRWSATVEPYLGSDSAGRPVYGEAMTARVQVERTRRIVRGPGATELVAGVTIRARLADVPNCPPESRVTVEGDRPRTVLVEERHDNRGLPTPDHVEVLLT